MSGRPSQTPATPGTQPDAGYAGDRSRPRGGLGPARPGSACLWLAFCPSAGRVRLGSAVRPGPSLVGSDPTPARHTRDPALSGPTRRSPAIPGTQPDAGYAGDRSRPRGGLCCRVGPAVRWPAVRWSCGCRACGVLPGLAVCWFPLGGLRGGSGLPVSARRARGPAVTCGGSGVVRGCPVLPATPGVRPDAGCVGDRFWPRVRPCWVLRLGSVRGWLGPGLLAAAAVLPGARQSWGSGGVRAGLSACRRAG